MSERVHVIGESDRQSTIVEDPRAIDEPTLAFFLDYWRSKRDGRALPLWTSWVAKEIKSNLCWTIVVDALPDYVDFRYRVVGSRICDYYKSDATGKTVRTVYASSPELGRFVQFLFGWSCTARVPLRCTNPVSSWNKTFFAPHDTLYLPYSSDGETANRVVVAFAYQHQAFQKPRTIDTAADASRTR